MSAPEFEKIVGRVEGEGGIDTWRIAYETTRDEVTEPGGSVMPSVIGTIAWDRLLPVEQEQAQLDLFDAYGNWLEQEKETQRRYDAQLAESLLEDFDLSAVQGEVDRQPGSTVAVERDRLARVLDELERLQNRLAEQVAGGAA